MIRALLKKQMMEVFSWLYADKKSGKLRSAKGIAGYGLLYLLLFGFLAVVFGVGAHSLCGPFLAAGMGWLYWCLMGLVSVFFGVLGSVFNTYSSLYQAKDNDFLLSMPIPASRILLARLSGVYAMGLMYELIAILPTLLIWLIHAPLTVLGTINALLIPLVLSLFILVLSAILGWVVALVMTKVKHKNMVIVLLSLLFIAAYWYVYAKASILLQTILLDPEATGNKLRYVLYPLYQMGLAAEGKIGSMLIFTGMVLVLTALTYAVLTRSFLKLATTSRGTAKTVYREKRTKVRSVNAALLQKEFFRFTGSANYMLNCGLGILLMPLFAFVLIWKADVIRAFLASGIFGDSLPLLAVGIICMMVSMNDLTAPSISLEGKSLWIAQSLPVSARQILMAKLNMHLILTLLPAAFPVAVAEWLLKPQFSCAILMPAVVALFILLMAETGLALDLKMPNLHWNSEIVPTKQSTPILIALFGSWAMIVALGGLYVLLKRFCNVSLFLGLLCILLAIACLILFRWLQTKGAGIFERLR